MILEWRSAGPSSAFPGPGFNRRDGRAPLPRLASEDRLKNLNDSGDLYRVIINYTK